MAGTTVNVSIRMDAEMKMEAEALFADLGLSFGAAVNVFVRQAVRQGGLPFQVKLGKKRERKQETAPETLQKQSVKETAQTDYSNLEEFFASLDAG